MAVGVLVALVSYEVVHNADARRAIRHADGR